MTTYYNLFISCPACIYQGYLPGIPSYWYHSDCGGILEVGDNACYRCSWCGYTTHIKNWRYACESHQGSYWYTNSNHFASAVTMAAQVMNIGGRQWFLNLLCNLGDW